MCIRDRIRDPHLVMQMVEIGDSSRTDVALCYMSDRADEEPVSYTHLDVYKRQILHTGG